MSLILKYIKKFIENLIFDVYNVMEMVSVLNVYFQMKNIDSKIFLNVKYNINLNYYI